MDDAHLSSALNAAKIFAASAKKVLSTDDGVHIETLISSISRVAGSMMYRSFALDASISPDIKPGTHVLSEQANIYGPHMMNILLITLQKLGTPLHEGDMHPDYATAKFSQLSFQEASERLVPFFQTYCEAASMSHLEAAMAAAMAAALTIYDYRDTLAVEKGASIAVFGFVEGTKTAPYPVSVPLSTSIPILPTPVQNEPAKKRWYQFW